MSEPEHTKKSAKLGALRATFATALPERLEAIETCWRRAEAANTWGDAYEKLMRLAHSLAGSAGTFGYRGLGVRARELEETLVLLSRASNPQFIQRKKQIAVLIDALCSLDQALPDEDGEIYPVVAPYSTDEMTLPINRSIVLIEDDVLLAQELAKQLSIFGWEVSVFANATTAFSTLKEPWPAAMIVDMRLPEGPLAGLNIMQRIQSHCNVKIPHVAISICNDWESRLAAVRSGAAAYLAKPIDISALEEQLVRITNPGNQAPYRVLLVDDDEILAKHFVQVLTAAGMDAIAITSPSQLLVTLTEHQPEIILMDLYMPECSGIEALKVIRQDSQFYSLPVVFLSTESGLASQQNAMQVGAEDFLQKPISDTNLIRTVFIRAQRFRALRELIHQDSMTSLLNHISFKLRLEAEIDRASRSNEPISLAMLDIDHFKSVNDTYGHAQGDRVIKSLAQMLRKRLRKSDIIGRYGGEEFIIAIPNTQPALAIRILDELRDIFCKLRFETLQRQFSCSFSCGVAAIPPTMDAMSLTNLADRALYKAKCSGRNRVELFIG